MLRQGLPIVSLFLHDFWRRYKDSFLPFFGFCLVVGKSNLNIVKGSYRFPTVHEINISIIFLNGLLVLIQLFSPHESILAQSSLLSRK